MFEQAIDLDPEDSGGYTMLGWTYLMDVWYGSSESPAKSMEQAAELAQRAIALDETQDSAHSLLGQVYLMMRQYDMAIAEGERAIALNPNGADAHADLAMTLTYAGRPVEAIALFKKAIRLNPMPPNWYLFSLCDAYCLTGQYEEAIAVCTKMLHRNPEDYRALIGLALTYSLMGREEEARAQAAQILRVSPKFSFESFAKTLPFKNKADTDLYIDSLRKAGLK
jgi:adenylate cyclase